MHVLSFSRGKWDLPWKQLDIDTYMMDKLCVYIYVCILHPIMQAAAEGRHGLTQSARESRT